MRYSLDCNICPFTQDPTDSEEDLRIIEGQHWVATTRLNDQEFLGTAYVSLRSHKESLTDLNRNEDDEFIAIRNKLITAQQRAFGANIINISCLMNNAFQDELAAPHVHYHFKPRSQEPVEFAGELFIDRQFGHYIKNKHSKPVSLEIGRLITCRLRNEITS